MKRLMMAAATVFLTVACGSGSAETAVASDPVGEGGASVSTPPAGSSETSGFSSITVSEPQCNSEMAGRAAGEATQAFVDRLVKGGETGNYEPAADLWSGIYAGSDAQVVLKELVAASPWLLDGEIVTVPVDAYSSPGFCPGQVVAVTDPGRRGTFAVLVDPDGTIQRIQGVHELSGPPEISSARVVLPTSPVEGGAVVYLDSTRLSDAAVAVDPNQASTAISLPTSSDGPRLLIVSMATPELPTAYSFVIPS